MIVTFTGHKDTIMSDELRQEAARIIEDAIKEGADTFYCVDMAISIVLVQE